MRQAHLLTDELVDDQTAVGCSCRLLSVRETQEPPHCTYSLNDHTEAPTLYTKCKGSHRNSHTVHSVSDTQ